MIHSTNGPKKTLLRYFFAMLVLLAVFCFNYFEELKIFETKPIIAIDNKFKNENQVQQ